MNMIENTQDFIVGCLFVIIFVKNIINMNALALVIGNANYAQDKDKLINEPSISR